MFDWQQKKPSFDLAESLNSVFRSGNDVASRTKGALATNQKDEASNDAEERRSTTWNRSFIRFKLLEKKSRAIETNNETT